jgi:hypothetical protein
VTSDLVTEVLHELAAAGLAPDPARYDYLAARLLLYGERVLRQLPSDVGGALQQRQSAAVRMLGFGYVMTEFAAAPVAVPSDARVPALGALANLIVSLYDAELDAGAAPGSIISGGSLLASLVELYYSRLDALARGGGPLEALLRRAINRMYHAERSTGGANSLAIWRRKSALPFVVMGLPAWFAHPAAHARSCHAHLAWLYRLGRFFGWIDDAADLEDDCAAGRLNYFRGAAPAGTATRIAREGTRILAEWQAGITPGRYAGVLSESFLQAAWAWLSAPGTATLLNE